MKAEVQKKALFPAGISRNVFVLGLVSFLTDLSSETTITLLPFFLANVLGIGTAAIGLIEGVAESTASLTKVFSGWLSDRLGRRKALVVVGYGLSSLSKPLLYFATTWGVVLGIRFADRVGKGVRTSPRDALVADSSPEDKRGLNFGFHRAADTAGAFVGLALAALIIYLGQQATLTMERPTYQWLVVFGTIPGLLAVLLLIVGVKETRRKTLGAAKAPSLTLRGFDLRFKLFLAITVLFALANSSDAFLLLRAQNLGLPVLHVTLLLVAFNLIYTLLATPVGTLSDRFGRRPFLVMGWLLYSVIYLGFAVAGGPGIVWGLFLLYGVYYAMTEGVGRALVADVVAPEQRGTAYGVYHGAIGFAALPASLIAGLLWQGLGGWAGFGASAPFYFGAGTAFLAAMLLLVALPARRQGPMTARPTL